MSEHVINYQYQDLTTQEKEVWQRIVDKWGTTPARGKMQAFHMLTQAIAKGSSEEVAELMYLQTLGV